MTAFFRANAFVSDQSWQAFGSLAGVRKAASKRFPANRAVLSNYAIINCFSDSKWRNVPRTPGGATGIYVKGDRLFAFLVDNNKPLYTCSDAMGLFVENDEGLIGSFKATIFRYEFIGADHIIHGCEDTFELSITSPADERAWLQLTTPGTSKALSFNLDVNAYEALSHIVGSSESVR